jgi:hypothetical protein
MDEDKERSPWGSPLTLFSGVFILLLIAAGVVVVVAHHGHKATTAQGTGTQTQVVVGKSTATSSPSTPAPTSTTVSTACSLPAGSQAIPSGSPPAGTTWGVVGSMSTPQAKQTLGPQHTDGVFNTCFAHSPAGALLAAINFWAESTAAPAGIVYKNLAVDVPAAALKTTTDTFTGQGGSLQLAGFEYQSYASSRALISVVLQGQHGALEAVVTPMVWVNGDWRVQFPVSAAFSEQVLQGSTVTSPYVPWSDFA